MNIKAGNKTPSLNSFLVFMLVINIILNVINFVPLYFFIPLMNIPSLYVVLYFVIRVAQIISSIGILKKRRWGLFGFFGMLLCLIIIQMIYFLYLQSDAYIRTAFEMVGFALLLLIRCNGQSAWSVVWHNGQSIDQTENENPDYVGETDRENNMTNTDDSAI